jgi:mannitol/fructose-specific phosphotransferase system IIA component (Ntr-type)
MKLTELVTAEAIVADLKAAERDQAIAELIDALIDAGQAPAENRGDLIQAIVDREQHGSTGFGKGVAVPHVKHEKVTQRAAAIGVSHAGVDFNALDKAPVYSIFLLLSPADQPDEHLQAMETIFSNLQKESFRKFLRQASTRQEVLDLLEEADAQKLPG